MKKRFIILIVLFIISKLYSNTLDLNLNKNEVFYDKNEVGPFCTHLVQQAVNNWEQQDIIRDDITVVCVYF